MSIAGSEGSTAGMAKSMPRVMPRAHIASTMGTRFPLVKGTYFKDDVAGVVNLLYFTDQDAPKAAQVSLHPQSPAMCAQGVNSHNQ